MNNYKNILASMMIIMIVFLATIFVAIKPFEMISLSNSNLSFFNFQRVCAQDDNYRNNIVMVVDRSVQSHQTDLITSQMIDEAVSRHIKVSILGKFGKDDCNVSRINKINGEDLPYIADTFNYQNNTLADYADVVNTCKSSVLNYGKCILVTNPTSYMTNEKFDNEKYRYYLETIKSL